MKKTLNLLLALVFLFGMMQTALFSASAVENLVPADGEYEVDVYVQPDLPQAIQDRILAHFLGENVPDRNILCTLFGHKNP